MANPSDAVQDMLGNSVGGQDPLLSHLAIIVSVLSIAFAVYFSWRQISEQNRQHLIRRWDDLLLLISSHPQFLDLNFTENYFNPKGIPKYIGFQDEQVLFTYETFNYKAWALVESIVRKGLSSESEYFTMIQWIYAYHGTWLARNPLFFQTARFWKVVGGLGKQPLALVRWRPLPRSEDADTVSDELYKDDIDWEYTAENYDNLILGPFAVEMVTPDANGHIRNHLLSRLLSIPRETLSARRIADYGCGPGNILKHIAGQIPKLYGIDWSRRPLKIAERRAADLGVEFIPVPEDMRTHVPEVPYDIIISVNSILPRTRDDVIDILVGIRNALSDDGLFLAVLPSFDTTLRLSAYWMKHYRKLFGRAHARRSVEAFKQQKKINIERLSYADDGVHSQCFHTPDSMRREFAKAGLQIIEGPTKVHYPWSLTRRFDYGYFPGEEEIWDWFIVAKKV